MKIFLPSLCLVNKDVYKGIVGVSRDCPNFLGTPYYLRNGERYGFQILHAHL